MPLNQAFRNIHELMFQERQSKPHNNVWLIESRMFGIVPVLFTTFFGLKVFAFWPATEKKLQLHGEFGLHCNAIASSVQLGHGRLESEQYPLFVEKYYVYFTS